MGKFEGKVVIITGAASGTGAATAVAFAKEGAKLAVVDKNERGLNDTAQKCKSIGCTNVLEIVVDLAVFENLESVIKKTVERFKEINVLVNVAGFQVIAKIEDTDIKSYEHIFRVNLTAPVFLSQYALPHLKKSKGNIVNVSSVTALRVAHSSVPYSMSKIALDHFARGFAAECVEHEVLVNNVNPGYMDTPFFTNCGFDEEVSKKLREGCLQKQTLGSVSSEEIADAILLLGSTRNMTGQNIVIDRGMLLEKL